MNQRLSSCTRIAANLIVLVGLALFLKTTAARAAGEPRCAVESNCGAAGSAASAATALSALITPVDGGELLDPAAGFRLTFPPASVVVQITVHYSTLPVSPAPLQPGKIGLATFALQAVEAGGAAHAEVAEPWSAEIDYRLCGSEGARCPNLIVNEASIRCATLTPAGEWREINSQVDVIQDRVTCSATAVSALALVADPVETSGYSDLRLTFLPVIHR